MLHWLRELDDLLRGNKTRQELLAVGTRHMPLGPFAGMGLILGIAYGLFMGLFAVLSRPSPCYEQLAAAAIKVPALFFLTLVVTYPSLYVFGALLGVRLGPGDMLRLVVAALAVNLAILASFGPITGFFTLSTTSYHFIKLLNVAFFTISGFIGLAFLLKALERLEEAQWAASAPPAPSPPVAEGGAGPPPVSPVQVHTPWPAPDRPSKARDVFRVWVILYALVGAQMGWVLRPFILDPKLDFVLFRGRQANIFLDVLQSLGKLLGGR